MTRLLMLSAMLACTFPVLAQDPAKEAKQDPPPTTTAPKESGEADKVTTPAKPRVKLETSMGDMVLELEPGKAPKTVENFVQYVKDGFYDGIIFYKVMRDQHRQLIQAGPVTPDMEYKRTGLRPGIECEWPVGLTNQRGTVAMSRQVGAPNSTSSDFYINMADNEIFDKPQRDGKGFTVFGRVVEGMDVAEKIWKTELHSHPKYRGLGTVVPTEPVIIKKASLLDAQKPAEEKPEPAPPAEGSPEADIKSDKTVVPPDAKGDK